MFLVRIEKKKKKSSLGNNDVFLQKKIVIYVNVQCYLCICMHRKFNNMKVLLLFIDKIA